MNSRGYIDAALEEMRLTYKDAAEKIGWSKSKINAKLSRDSTRATEFINLLEANGVGIILINKKTGERIYPYVEGHGEPATGVSEYVRYDTAKSYALSNTFFEDGVNEYNKEGKAQELYVTQDGKYFIVNYESGKKPKLRGVTPEVARAFIEKYGTELEKRTDQN